MKQTMNSFLQTVFQSVKTFKTKVFDVSKKTYRSALAMTAGISVVTVMTFTAGGFQGGGRNALVAFAETPEQTSGVETELENADVTESAANGETAQEMEGTSEETVVETEAAEEAAETETEAEQVSEDESEEAEKVEDKEMIVLKDKTTHIRRVVEEPEETEEPETEEETEKISLSDKDYDVLLRIVQAEAGNCDETGKLLVANVILNRMESEKFPDTVSGVVYQKCQFSPVSNGTINTCKVTEETVEAVERALEGEDLSEGALYFMNRKASTGRNARWFDNHLDYLFQHEEHEFFK